LLFELAGNTNFISKLFIVLLLYGINLNRPHIMKKKRLSLPGLMSIVLLLCLSCKPQQPSNISTIQDREALFQYILDKTMEREAFSPVKDSVLDIHIEDDMELLRVEFIHARSDEELFYALVKLSNLRHDRHLKMYPIEGGLKAPDNYNRDANTNYPHFDRGPNDTIFIAPVRFHADYRGDPFIIFVRDYATDLEGKINVGDRLLSINGTTAEKYFEKIRPYFRYSSEPGFRVRATEALNEKTAILPAHFYENELTVELESENGNTYNLTLPYRPGQEIEWSGIGERDFDAYDPVMKTEGFKLLKHKERKIILFVWNAFGDSVHPDMDRVMEWAEKEGVLDYDVIFDGTESRGGGRGVYAVQRMSSLPFKMTFGNLRISDITDDFVDRMVTRIDAREERGDSLTNSDIWLRDWLINDVRQAIEGGNEYTNNVPFKSSYLPKDADGIIQPAPVHFTGRMVCLFGPYGGSHLDQFSCTVIDNDLCHSIGMPTGGYSNTWEWTEQLVFPISGKPVVRYMWNIGHTIRPNGEILEGNPAMVKEQYILTAENWENYYQNLYQKAYDWLDNN